MPTTTKLKSREELDSLLSKIDYLIKCGRFDSATDLLQQLQEENVRCCAEVGRIKGCVYCNCQTGIPQAILALLPATQPQPEEKKETK